MGIPLREGREFDGRTAAGEVVVNEALARQQWPDGGGLGERLRVGPEGEPLTVIGIAANNRDHGRRVPAHALLAAAGLGVRGQASR